MGGSPAAGQKRAGAPPAEDRPTPLGGPGTLSVKDNRTGKTYELQLDDHGLLNAKDLKQITAGGDGLGLRTYDPGYLPLSGPLPLLVLHRLCSCECKPLGT